MRRVFAGLLLLSVLAGQLSMLGAVLGRYHAQYQMHHRIEEAPEALSKRADIQHLTLSPSDRHSPNASFVRIEEREFRYRGNLYDVVHEEWEGEVWHVWVVHDREEEQYLDALSRSMNGPIFEGTTTPAHQGVLVYRPLAVLPGKTMLVPAPKGHAQSYLRFSSSPHQPPYLEVPHPPPWG